MEGTHLASFEVSGFKKFIDLKVENIGQFNLIVGDNNVGKTTLLEALLIDRDSKKFLESLATIMFHIKKFTYLSDSFFAQFVSNNIGRYPKTVRFKLNSKDSNYEIVKYYQINNNQFTHISTKNSPLPDNNDLEDASLIDFHNIIVDDKQQFNFKIPYIPFGSLYSHELTKQYSDYIQLYVDKKENLIDSLSHMITGIKNIEVNASYSHQPILLISEKNKNKLSPLATYGDGTVKLFRILLSLFANDYNNRLMIDEIDAGVHYSRLKEFLKSLIRVAKEQKKQIFATTHSKECIEYFTQAIKEVQCEEDGRIIRLAETKSGIKAYTNIYDQFENALIAESELR